MVQIFEHYSDEPTILNSRAKFLAIFPNQPYLRFAGALHEQLVDHRYNLPPAKVLTLSEVIYHHYGYTKIMVAQHDKRARNMRILLNEIENRPEDDFVRFNYAQELRAVRKYDEALEQVRECFRLLEVQNKSLGTLYVESAYILYANLLVRRRDFEGVLKVCEDGLKVFPKCFDLLGRRGLALLATNRTEQAIASLEAALRQKGAMGGGGSSVAYTGCVSESLLAIAHWRLGDVGRCEHHLRRALMTSVEPQKTVERFVNFCGLLLGDRKAAVTLFARIGVRLDYTEKSNTSEPGPTSA
jgi:tetratricopeptide (TPR) repeat protein